MKWALVGLAVLLATPATAQAQSGSAVIDSLPADTVVVASVDVTRARRSPWFGLLRKRVDDRAVLTEDLAALYSSTMWRRTQRVWLAAPQTGFERDKVVVLVKARIRPADIDSWVEKRRGSAPLRHSVGQHSYASSGQVAWALLPGGLIAVCHPDRMPAVLAASDTRTRTGPNRLLRTAVAEARRSRSHAWVAMIVPKSARAELAKKPLMSSLSKMRWLAARMILGKDLRVTGLVHAGDPEAAELVAGLLNQMIQAQTGAGHRAGSAKSTAVARGAEVHIEGRIDAVAARNLLAPAR